MAFGTVAVGTYPGAETGPHWPRIVELLEPAAKRGGIPVWEPGETVWVAIADGAIIAAGTSRMVDAETAELIHVSGAGRKEWFLPWEAAFCAWARSGGALQAIMRGRKGWARLIAPLGWVVTDKTKRPDGMFDYQKALDNG